MRKGFILVCILLLISVNIEGQQILVLLDVDFILCVKTYASTIYQNILNPEANELVRDALESLKSSGQKPKKVKFELAEPSSPVEENRRGFKLQGIVEKFVVALLDPEQSVEQVVTLQVCVCAVCTNILVCSSTDQCV